MQYNNPAETTHRRGVHKKVKEKGAWSELGTGVAFLMHYHKLTAAEVVIPSGKGSRFIGYYILLQRPNAYVLS